MSMLLDPRGVQAMPMGGFPNAGQPSIMDAPQVPQQQMQQANFGQRFKQNMGPILQALGYGIASGNLGRGAAMLPELSDRRSQQRMQQQEMAQEQQRLNATYEWAKTQDPEVADMIAKGIIDPNTGFKLIQERRQAAQQGQKPPTPYSEAAQLKADLDNGYITPEAYQAQLGSLSQGKPDMDTKELFKQEQDLRKEYNSSPTVEGYSKVRDAYQRIRASAAQDSGPGDIGVIFGYMKMLDPSSTVREGEFATAENSAGIPAYVRNMWNKALSGERLTPETRAQMVAGADALYAESAKDVEDTNKRYGGIADQWNVPQDRVLVQPEKFEPLSVGQSKQVAPGVTIKKVR
jgi:hypothetical protein